MQLGEGPRPPCRWASPGGRLCPLPSLLASALLVCAGKAGVAGQGLQSPREPSGAGARAGVPLSWQREEPCHGLLPFLSFPPCCRWTQGLRLWQVLPWSPARPCPGFRAVSAAPTAEPLFLALASDRCPDVEALLASDCVV